MKKLEDKTKAKERGQGPHPRNDETRTGTYVEIGKYVTDTQQTGLCKRKNGNIKIHHGGIVA